MTNHNVGVRPDLKAVNEAIANEHREGKSHGLMHDAFIEAVKVRFNNIYATGLEEREALRRIDKVMADYFTAKKHPEQAFTFVTPEHLRNLIETMSQAAAVDPGEIGDDERTPD